ncbi:MAG: endolytic transglycosylase MltG [Candidatus Nanopelagicales bacterium]
MSNVGLSMQQSPSPGKQPKHPKKKKGRSGAAVFFSVLIIVVLVGAVAVGGLWAFSKFQAAQPAEDYPGPGSGEVVIEVTEGETLTDIGATLQKADVVASTQAFAEAAALNNDATSITPGTYVMLQQMKASDAVKRLLDPESSNSNTVTVVEGMRVKQVIALLSEASGIPAKEFEKVVESPSKLPLPSWAKGTGSARAEGFLFPATYQFDKSSTPEDMLNQMVAKFNEVADEMNFVDRSKKTGYTPYEVLNIASLIQAEAHQDDFNKVSRVIYNRLDPDTWGETYGYLGLDATLNYALDQFETNISESDLELNSPYNTRTEKHQGLPPTPINNPGVDAMEAALKPDKGTWLYYATVNLDTGETKFTDNYDEFLRFQQELRDWEAANPQ